MTSLSMINQAKTKGFVKLWKFLIDTSERDNIRVALNNYSSQVYRVKNAYIKSLRLRESRRDMLDRFFEIEKKIMMRYYFERQKKVKKYKTYYANLKAMEPEAKAKLMILEGYY